MANENADVEEERKKQEQSRNETILVQQVNKCTIMSPDMSIQELAGRLTSVGLSLADVRVTPLVRPYKERKRAESQKADIAEMLDAAKERWQHTKSATNRHKVPGWRS